MSDDAARLSARHLLVCQRIEYELDNRAAPYTLRGVIATLPPLPFPARALDQLWVYVQFFGRPGMSDVWLKWVRVEVDGSRETDTNWAEFGPWPVRVGGRFVESRGWRLDKVPYYGPGIYELRLSCGDEVLATERVFWEG